MFGGAVVSSLLSSHGHPLPRIMVSHMTPGDVLDEKDCFCYIIVQTHDVGLHSRRHPKLDAVNLCIEQAAHRNSQHENVLAWLDAHYDVLTSGQCPARPLHENTRFKRVAALLNSVQQRFSRRLKLPWAE